jgi:hypothetical protein
MRKKEENYNTLPDLWPWLEEQDSDESDQWVDQPDPLSARRIPRRARFTLTEEDILYTQSEDMVTIPLPVTKKVLACSFTSMHERTRIIFICLTALALFVLLLDSALVSLAFWHQERRKDAPKATASTSPTLTLSSTVVTHGQKVTLSMRNFSPSTRVFLTHDRDEPVFTNASKSVVQIDQQGSAQVLLLIDANWGPGIHTLQAEDVKTHYIATTILRIEVS